MLHLLYAAEKAQLDAEVDAERAKQAAEEEAKKQQAAGEEQQQQATEGTPAEHVSEGAMFRHMHKHVALIGAVYAKYPARSVCQGRNRVTCAS